MGVGEASATARDGDVIPRSTWVAMGAMALAVLAIANDFTAMNVVLPTIEGDLDSSLSAVQWVVNGYALVFGVLIVPGGRLADVYGRSRMLCIGAALFAAFSFLGGLAPNVGLLIAARVLMAVGGALMWPAILGLIYGLLPESKAGLAGGLVIGVAGIGNATGPLIAGALALASWRWIFFLNIPIALIALVVTWRTVPRDEATEREPIDYAGSALLSLSLGALLGALTVAPAQGWADPLVVGGLVAAVVLMVGFVLRERSTGEDGLVPPSVIRNGPFLAACLAALCMSATFFASLLYLPQLFQKIQGEGTMTAGVKLLPFVAVFALASFTETWLLGKIGLKAVVSLGAVCVVAGPVLFVLLLDDQAAYLRLVPGMVVLGVGVGLFFSAATTAGLTAVDPSRSSLAGGLLYMFQIGGGAVGLGLTTVLFLASADAGVRDAASDVGVELSDEEVRDLQGVLVGTESSAAVQAAHPEDARALTEVVRDAFVDGVRVAFTFDAVLALVGVGLVLTRVGGPLSRLGRDVDHGDAADPAHDRTGTDPPAGRHRTRRHRHAHRHVP